MENLYDYIFWFNHHEEIWYAIKREHQLDFFNGNRDKAEFIKSKEHSVLVELLTKPSILKQYNKE